MSQQELQRLKVVESEVEGRLRVAEGAVLLGLGERQVKRLKRNYNATDAEWVHHGNAGRQPANAMTHRDSGPGAGTGWWQVCRVQRQASA